MSMLSLTMVDAVLDAGSIASPRLVAAGFGKQKLSPKAGWLPSRY